MDNIEQAAHIADFKYLTDQHSVVWLFDHSCAFAEGAKCKNVKSNLEEVSKVA